MSSPHHYEGIFRESLLPTAARVVIPLQYGFAIYLLLRGHNLPGGGFIGGLVFASALVLRVMVDQSRAPRFDLEYLAGLGLVVAALSAMIPLFLGREFFTGLWWGELWLPVVGKTKIGTVLTFDIGVFLVVTAVAGKILMVLLAQHRAGEHMRAQRERQQLHDKPRWNF